MKDEKKTLVLILPGFPKDEADSACLPFQLSFARHIKKHFPGLNVLVFTLQYPFEKGSYFIGSLSVYSFGGQNKGGLSKFWLRKKIARKLEEVRNRDGIAVILSFWCGETALAGKRFVTKYPETKHFCWLMGQDAKPSNKYVSKINLVAGEVIALSDFLQGEFEKNYQARPATVIPPGFDHTLTGKSILERDIDIIAAGSLINLKRFDLFLQVISNIKKEYPGIKAILAGDGPERKQLQQLINESELQANITLAGELPHHVLLQLMQRSRLLLHTSSYEGFGMVCLEALFAGAQVISFTRPLKRETEGWHFASSMEEMTQMALVILQKEVHQAIPAPDLTIEKCVTSFMKLAGLD